MDYRRIRQVAGYYIAPCLLIAVALFQKYNVHALDQLAGRGGGFGMFSTVDTTPTRMLRFYLLADQGEALVLDPRRTRVLGAFYVERLLIKPTDEHLREAARRIAATPWSIYDVQDLKDISDKLPDDLQSYLAEDIIWQRRNMLSSNPDSSKTIHNSGSYPSRVALPKKAGDDSSPYSLQGVRVEIWTSTFNEENHRLVSKKLKEVMIKA